MKATINFIFFLILISNEINAQKPAYSFSGIVKNDSTGELLNGASVKITGKNIVMITDKDGYFNTTLESGKYYFEVVYVGFKKYSADIRLDKNIHLIIPLKTETVNVKETVVTGKNDDQNIKNPKAGELEIKIEKIKTLPSLLGETDLIKSVQLIPGVQSSDGGAGLFVRGSGLGQNLTTYDNAVIYNPTHLMSFFSAFNSDAIDKVKLIKSGMPSYYGGRIASVVEISGKNGNNQTTAVSGGIGLISSRLTIESPIKKDKGSVIISGRRTYLDLLSKPINDLANEKIDFFKTTKYYFSDINFKAVYNVGNKDALSLSSYDGNDNYQYSFNNADFTNIKWGNRLASFKWTHLFNGEVYWNNTAYFTNYFFKFKAEQNTYDFVLNSSARDWCYKSELSINKFRKQKIKTGLDFIVHNFSPIRIDADVLDLKLNFYEQSDLHTNEYALYVHDEVDVSSHFIINAGLRYSLFQHLGPFIDYEKDFTSQISDTVIYSRNQLIKYYNNPEPRLSLCYILNDKSSVKASFTHNYQYIHLVSIPSVSMPSDIWMPSMKSIKPEFGAQYSLGYFSNFKNNMFESYIDAYYKHVDNLIEFEKSVINSVFEQTMYKDIATGKGEMMGIEFYLKKNKGNFNGWISYTLSKAVNQFDGLNGGKAFPASQDRRNDLSVVINYEMNKKWNFSAVFVYTTGKPVTMPDKLYVIQENIISEYGDRNAFRLPDYHRMDISLTYNLAKRKNRQSSLNFSIYNVYNRPNPFYVYFETKGNMENYNFEIKAKQVSLFPFLPSLTWSYKFH